MANIIIAIDAQGDPCKVAFNSQQSPTAEDKVATTRMLQGLARASSAGKFPKVSKVTAAENRGR